jgi:hypothetical protein
VTTQTAATQQQPHKQQQQQQQQPTPRNTAWQRNSSAWLCSWQLERMAASAWCSQCAPHSSLSTSSSSGWLWAVPPPPQQQQQ